MQLELKLNCQIIHLWTIIFEPKLLREGLHKNLSSLCKLGAGRVEAVRHQLLNRKIENPNSFGIMFETLIVQGKWDALSVKKVAKRKCAYLLPPPLSPEKPFPNSTLTRGHHLK